MVRPQVHSKKHYVQMSRFTVGANAEVPQVLIDSQAISATNLVNEVVEGSSVKAIYIELWAIGDGVLGATIVSLAKFPVNAVDFTFAQMAAMGQSANKNNVLFFHQGLASNDGITSPIAIMRGWYKIPKTKQRFALADRLVLQCASQTAGTDTVDFCGFATYKEYS